MEGRTVEGYPIGSDRSSATSERRNRFQRLARGGTSSINCCWRTKGSASRERLTLIRLFEELRGALATTVDTMLSGVTGTVGARSTAHRRAAAYVLASFAPGSAAYQFDWSHEVVLPSGVIDREALPMSGLGYCRMLLSRSSCTSALKVTQEMVVQRSPIGRSGSLFRRCTRRRYSASTSRR